jgi:hypothetical protein
MNKLTTSKKDNSSNKNKNTFYDFMPYWKNEEKCFTDTITNMSAITVSKTKKGNITVTEKTSFPPFKPVEQRAYEAFKTKITNPLTGEFYAERDLNGNQIPQPNGSPNAKYVIHTIVRLKRFDGYEVLYSQGQLQGFNSLGSQITTSISKPEVRNRTTFFNERRYDEKSQTTLDICKGPRGFWSCKRFFIIISWFTSVSIIIIIIIITTAGPIRTNMFFLGEYFKKCVL